MSDCYACRFAVFAAGQEPYIPVGECHRNPPECFTDTGGFVVGRRWVKVNGDDWCGEYQDSGRAGVGAPPGHGKGPGCEVRRLHGRV